VENVLRALDDDTHAPVLINPSVTRDAFSPSGFPARHWAVLVVFFSPQQTLVGLFLTPVVVAVEKWKAFLLSKRSVFSTAIKRPPGAAAADVDKRVRQKARRSLQSAKKTTTMSQ
jgi:hypothetical protein